MFFGILRMPYNMAMANEISRHQYWQSGQQAAVEIERLREDLWKIMMAYPEESYAHVIAKSALQQKESE